MALVSVFSTTCSTTCSTGACLSVYACSSNKYTLFPMLVPVSQSAGWREGGREEGGGATESSASQLAWWREGGREEGGGATESSTAAKPQF